VRPELTNGGEGSFTAGGADEGRNSVVATALLLLLLLQWEMTRLNVPDDV